MCILRGSGYGPLPVDIPCNTPQGHSSVLTRPVDWVAVLPRGAQKARELDVGSSVAVAMDLGIASRPPCEGDKAKDRLDINRQSGDDMPCNSLIISTYS